MPPKIPSTWSFPSHQLHCHSHSCSGQNPGSHLGFLFAAYLANNPVARTTNSPIKIHPETSSFSLLHGEYPGAHLCHPFPNYLVIYQVSMLLLSPLLKPEWISLKHKSERVTHPLICFQRLSIASWMKSKHFPMTLSSLSFGLCPALQLLCSFTATLSFLLSKEQPLATWAYWTLELWLLRLRNWISHFI